jgi:hypothetical protein
MKIKASLFGQRNTLSLHGLPSREKGDLAVRRQAFCYKALFCRIKACIRQMVSNIIYTNNFVRISASKKIDKAELFAYYSYFKKSHFDILW